jgi:hypothetical protein
MPDHQCISGPGEPPCMEEAPYRVLLLDGSYVYHCERHFSMAINWMNEIASRVPDTLEDQELQDHVNKLFAANARIGNPLRKV